MTGPRLTERGSGGLPDELASHNLLRRALIVVALLVVIGLVIVLAPGLGEVRDKLAGINGWWLAVGVVLEVLSSASYVLMFRPVFCPSMSWKLSNQISWSEVGVGSIVPASGIGGLALGAWVLSQAGMPAERIARRSVAFFLIKGAINYVVVAVLGTLMAVGVLGPDRSLWLTAFPAALSAGALAAVVLVPRLGHDSGAHESRLRRGVAGARNALVDGAGEAVRILRSHDWMAITGSIGYYAWDNAVLWATFHAVGADVPLTVLMMGYLIGQIGGLLPIPGGLGGIDGGLIGTLIVYGAPAAATASAVLAFRVIAFWVPLIGGAIGFAALQRTLRRLDTRSVCRAAVGSAADRQLA